MKRKAIRNLLVALWAIILSPVLVFNGALAASDTPPTEAEIAAATSEAAANSAAWHAADAAEKEAKNQLAAAQEAGNEAAAAAAQAIIDSSQSTKTALHERNNQIAADLSAGGGSAEYNSETGVWEITLYDKTTITSSSSLVGTKGSSSTYVRTDTNGKHVGVPIVKETYREDALDALMLYSNNNHNMLQLSYNYVAYLVETSGNYGSREDIVSADREIAVTKILLGLTDKEAEYLKAEIAKYKEKWLAAQDVLDDPKATEEEKERAREEKAKANDDAEALRKKYGYSAYEDGGYYDPVEHTTPRIGIYIPPDPDPDPVTGLSIQKNADKDTYKPGETITWTIKVVNHGEEEKENITVTDDFTGDVWTIDKLAAGEARTFITTHIVPEDAEHGTEIKNVVVVKYGDDTTEAEETVTVDDAGVSITKTAERSVYNPGEEITWKINVTNEREEAAENIVVVDQFTGDTWTIEYLAAGATHTFTATYKVPQNAEDGTIIRNVAVATYDGKETKAEEIVEIDVPETFNIKVTVGANGAVVDEYGVVVTKKSYTFKVKLGDSKLFLFSPDPGYVIDKLTIDGVNAENPTSLKMQTFNGICSDHTMSVTFTKGFTIKATAGTGGTIRQCGEIGVQYGDEPEFWIEANTGYKIKDVKVDGKSKGAIAYYKFDPIRTSHTIHASFDPDPKPGEVTLTPEGTSGPDSIKAGYGFTGSLPVTANGYEYVESAYVEYNFDGGEKERYQLDVVSDDDGLLTFEFARNDDSKLSPKPRKIYVPVETPDGEYEVKFYITLVYIDDDGDEIRKTVPSVSGTGVPTATITVKGTMYEDDFTGDR